MVQWLRIGTFTAVGAGLNPGWGTKILHAAWCGLKTKQNRGLFRDFPGGPAAKTSNSQCRGLGSIPCQGTRSRMSQLRPGAAK